MKVKTRTAFIVSRSRFPSSPSHYRRLARDRWRAMVSKRQKEARKRFEGTNARPEDATTSIPKAEKGMKSRNTKRRKEGGFKKKSGTSALRKHPLRVPGMRPGESCYICKSTSHITKLCPEKAVWERKKGGQNLQIASSARASLSCLCSRNPSIHALRS
ncbi:uncharacterized protein LOC122012529 [Zingiber officinale]|uniref:uncharacterized protein LOC122012529 n=1 Tax=Zingiber officinale TaxID=94328 RepID=UPI001C4C08D2|nr:uncharacterized protein LOC122012529 [Zingiber officinale]